MAHVREVSENEHWAWARGFITAPLGCRGKHGLCRNGIEFVVNHPKRRDYWCGLCLPTKYREEQTWPRR